MTPATQYLKTPAVIERYDISKITLHRWIKREQNPFPKPRINQQGKGCHRLWALEDLLAWEANQQN